MTTTELERRLLAEGCNPANYALNSRSYDGYCLMRRGRRQWAVFYSERGDDQPPIFSCVNEHAACRFFFDFVMQMKHRQMVGLLRSEAVTQALRARLEVQGVATHAYRLHYAQNDYRQVVSLVGKDIFRARALLGRVPVEYEEDIRPGVWAWLRRHLG